MNHAAAGTDELITFDEGSVVVRHEEKLAAGAPIAAGT